MRLEKLDQRGEQPRLARASPELICPDSGQVEEAPGPLRLIERCGKRRECKGVGIGWRLAEHGLELNKSMGGSLGEDPDR